MSDRLQQEEAALSAIIAWERRIDAEATPDFSTCLRRYQGPPEELIPELVAHYRLHWSGEDNAWIDELVEANPDWEGDIRAIAAQIGAFEGADNLSTEDPPSPSDRLGPYLLLERLASGGFADVYRAASSEGGRVVVLKALRHGEHEPGDTLAALTHERRTLKQLPSHPGLLQYEDWEPDPRRPAIVTSYIDGQTLRALRERLQPTETEAVLLMLRLADAVEAAHTAGVYHRDLKPENVLVRREGATPVIVDFGLAELRDEHSGAVTSAERLGGSAEFAPPEVYDPEAYGWPDGKRMDIYGLGAVLYFLLVGRGPNAAETLEDTHRRARSGAVDWARLAAAPYSEPLKRVCRQALDHDPAKRFENVSQLRRALSQSPAGRRLAWDKRVRRSGPKFLVATACLALAAYSLYQTVGFERMSRLLERRTPPAANAWVAELANERGIDLAAVRPDDFQVLVGCVERTPQVSSVERPAAGAAGLLVVLPDARLRALTDSLLYRVGPSRWRPFPYRGDRGEPFAYLTDEEVEAGFAVQLRIDAQGEYGTIAGPFEYPHSLRESVARDSLVVGRQRIAEASRVAWLADEPSGWALDRAFIESFGDLVAEYRVAAAGDQAASFIAVRAREDETPKEFGGRFAGETYALQSTHAVQVSLAFRDGSTSEPTLLRRHNPYGHDGTDASALSVLAEVPAELPMACLRVGNFNLAGLALADLALEAVEVGPTAHEPEVVLPVRWSPTGQKGVAKTPTVLAELARARVKVLSSERHMNPSPILMVGNGECHGAALPPVWRSVYVRGRLKGGGVTPIYRIDNEFPLPGYELPVHDATPGAPPVRTFLYGYAPTRAPEGVLRPQSVWQPDAWLYSIAPDGTRVEYYADERFRTRLHDIDPGTVYARVFTDEGTVGGYQLRIDKDPLEAVLAKAAELPSAVEASAPAASR